MTSVLFVQLPPPRFSFAEPPSNIPLAAGFLASALKASGKAKVLPEVLGPDIVDVYADRGLAKQIAARRPDILAVTLYVWNVQRSLFLASAVKRLSPRTKVIVGGPEVTPDNRWVLRHPGVDAAVFGEGESRIVPLVEVLAAGKGLAGIPGAFLKKGDRVSIDTSNAPAWKLDRCPYPYLNGAIVPSRDGTLFLETVRGCPFRCRYCYYHKAYDRMRSHPKRSVEAVLDFAYSPDSQVREIYLMDPTFNAHRGFRTMSQSMARRRSSKEIAVHTELRADILGPRDVELLLDAGLATAEIGLQTTNSAALAAAGRQQGNPGRVAKGVMLLKNAGVEVTTGIILGLPNDTPGGFSRTLDWLKRTGAYSVIHPFVLSVLPGTDFRNRATELGLMYDNRPPYYIRSTPSFPADAFMDALIEYEEKFDVELDAIPRPSLVDNGPAVIAKPDDAAYVSKWIVSPERRDLWSKLLPLVLEKASDPFTLWFRGECAENAILEILKEFAESNPHAVLNVVFETQPPPRPSFLERAVEVSGDPGTFLNRSYAPISGEGTIVTPDFTIVLPDPGEQPMRSIIADAFVSLASVVWERTADVPWPDVDLPICISTRLHEQGRSSEQLFSRLEGTAADRPEEVLFRDQALQIEWQRRTGKIHPAALWPEIILKNL